MGMTEDDGPSPTAGFLEAFRARAGAGGAMGFDGFVDLALYNPSVGYYRRAGARVGRGPGTDFFTASSLGPLFGELLVSACRSLLGGRDPGGFTFVEIGVEAPGGVMAGVKHPFGAARTVAVAEEMELAGPCVVFSNELFDAQAFRRYRFRAGAWRELGVQARGNELAMVELSEAAPAPLPETAPEGALFDAPLGATALLQRIATQPWTGLFVACDYGRTWEELARALPGGTARAYRRHVQSNDLLAYPGRQDLTCHVCWDWLSGALSDHGFDAATVDSQEAFFVRNAGGFLEGAIRAEAGRFSPRKAALQELLHPAHLGQKFQVLHASRFALPGSVAALR
jgi:SAM-dependent MidA family methyltransferase